MDRTSESLFTVIHPSNARGSVHELLPEAMFPIRISRTEEQETGIRGEFISRGKGIAEALAIKVL
jgi:hypothetical protein